MSITPASLTQLVARTQLMAMEVLTVDMLSEAASAALLDPARAVPAPALVATVMGRISRPLAANQAYEQPLERTLPNLLRANGAPMPPFASQLHPVRDTYHVSIAGKMVALPLRGSYRDGEQVRVVIEPSARSAAALGAAATPSLAAAPSNLQILRPEIGMALNLSPEGQRLGALLQRMEGVLARVPLSLPALAGMHALSSAAERSPSAAALARAVSESGLFYESHLAEWVSGRRGLDTLRREFQYRMRPGMQPTAAQSTGAQSLPSAPPQPLAPILSAADAGLSSAQNIAVSDADIAIPPALLPVVKEQLNAVDADRFTVYGAVWAQQPAELTIAREHPRQHRSAGQEGQQAAWSATLKMQLPVLGKVEAAFLLAGTTLRLAIASEARSHPAIRVGLARLSESLQARGLSLQTIRMEALGAGK